MFVMTPEELQRRHIRRAHYVSCDDAFVDVRLPGSTPKQNYSIIGPGVTQNPGQVINLREPHGFNIGAAGMGPGITNNLHLHFTAEVFIACEGRFTLRWGVRGDEGQAPLEPGDVICMPTWMFRGFSNSGTAADGGHGFLMTVLGGDDTGGILWSPEVLRRAAETGLFISHDNQLIELPPGSPAPSADTLLRPLPAEDCAALRRWTVEEMEARCVRRAERDFRCATLDTALPGHAWQLAPVAGFGISQHRAHRAAVTDAQGFSIDWVRVPPGQRSAPMALAEPAVLVHASGPLTVEFNDGETALHTELGAWDTLSLPAGTQFAFVNTGNNDNNENNDNIDNSDCEALLVVRGDAPKRVQFSAELTRMAAALDVALDAGGRMARLSVLPPGLAV